MGRGRGDQALMGLNGETPNRDTPRDARRDGGSEDSGCVFIANEAASSGGELEVLLEAGGVEVKSFSCGPVLLQAIAERLPDAVLLDASEPAIDGLEVCRRLRVDLRTRYLPILLASQSSSEHDQIAAYEAGADDVLAKPWHPKPTVLKLRRLIAARRLLRVPSRSLEYGPLVLCPERREALLHGARVGLAACEFEILWRLVTNPARVLSRRDLLGAGSAGTARSERDVDVYVTRLRRRLGVGRVLIETVRGVGYRIARVRDAER